MLRGKRAAGISEIVKPLQEIMGGVIRIESGRFYLQLPGQGNMEISLIADGYRKIAMLAYLAANGSLTGKNMLFWDEPEASLNPRITKKISKALIALVNRGVQVFLATHDLFVMKELSFLLEESEGKIPASFYGLELEDGEVKMQEGDLLEDIGTIAALDEVLRQDDEEQAFYVKGMR